MTRNSINSLPLLDGKAIVLAIKPKYAELILAGTKTVELRRSWSASDVGAIVIYASSPIQRLVGVVRVNEVIKTAPTNLWSYSKELGGGLTRSELREYFKGKPSGYAVVLRDAQRFGEPLDPTEVISNFKAPQSFRYLTEDELQLIWKNL
jgi:predicted transcriptional regulator